MTLLAGDLGGTKSILGLYEPGPDGLVSVREETFPSQSYPTFDALLEEFLARKPPGEALRAASFGIAGTVVEGRGHFTNLPWELDEKALADLIKIKAPAVRLLNDLEATAFGFLHLRPDEFAVLQPGATPGRKGTIGVIAAGTGLGEAMLCWDGQRHHPIASEGGHADFAPREGREIELLQYLSAQFDGHVSYERVLSGPGFLNIYAFLRDRGYFPESEALAGRLKTGPPNETIAALGMAGQDPLCAATVAMFGSLYGAEAGNLALRCLALGGVFVGGGIAPKLLAALRQGGFLRSFAGKGRLAPLLAKIEVRVALNPHAALLGAAHFALRLA